MSFTAAFTSDCESCSELVEVGQEARMVDFSKGMVAHVGCPAPRRTNPVCPECNLEHAGECW